MKIKEILPFLLFFLIVTSINAQTQGNRVPYVIYDNFDTGEMFTWEPYPYQQDTGYDPLFGTKKEPAYGGKGSSLSRLTKPNDANDLTQGFTKRIDMYALAGTRLKFAYFLMSDRRPETMDVSIGSFNGVLYTHTIKSPKANTWVEVDIPLESFKSKGNSLSAGEHLQVVVMKTFYPVVNHLPSYTMLMDEFRLNGERSRQFVSVSPKSTWFEQFGHSVINAHFKTSQAISLSVAAEDGIKPNAVSAELIGPDGRSILKNIKFYDDGTHGDLKSADGIWSNNAIYTIKPEDPRGQWKARITGLAGSQFSWDLGFIVPVSGLNAESHPRIFFTSTELAAKRDGNEPAAAKKLLDNLIKSYRPSAINIASLPMPNPIAPESVTGGPYASAGMGGWYNTQNALARIVDNEAWQFYLNGNKEAGERGRAALNKLCAMPSWNHPWMEANGNHTYYPGAPAAMAAAVGYDLLYQILSAQERAAIRKGIMENSIKPFYRDMVELNRMPTSNSNHIGVILSGVGLAAMAIANDDPDLPGLEPYLSGILAKTKQFIDRTMLPEGSYNEPYTYQEMGYRELVEFLFSLENNYGIDYTSTTYLKEFYQYPLYVTQNNRGKYQDLGDVSPTYSFTQQPSQWLVYKMKDPFMYKYVKPAWDSGNARGGILPYLWYTEGIIPKSREILPLSKHFEGKGHMVMRSSWDDSGSILIYKAGPNGNHYHYDQGTILLTHNGEELLSDAGHSSSYYANLYFPGYYTQAIGHNVMLIDMNAESQAPGDFDNGIASLKTYPKISNSFAGDKASSVRSDLTSVYKGLVSSYQRSLLYIKDGPVFLFDEVKSPSEHSYNWLFHAEHTNGKSSISYSDNRMIITRPEARLTMDVLSPEPLTSQIRNSDRSESFIAISSARLKDATFLAVMVPEGKPSNGDFALRPKAIRIESNGWIGARLKDPKADYFAFFKQSNSSNENIQGFTTDASRFTATLSNGKLSQAFFEGKRFSGFGSQLEFKTPVSASVSISDAGTDLELSSETLTELKIKSNSKPVSVSLNGKTVKNWKYDQKSQILSVIIPQGKSKINVN
ncbi:Heparinase II/III-like protein [Daejeonella rubra]|uniref:Heparinase II/III-like protein n=1 Tax=Daejeonella rubra TaxID=990371 RepID=A0A1G9SM36_9SPHI|nr:heparinase II/III family protein [Daejeonella rubra]SDM36538.1 Heparinase II/III-like protein [Daejeonella rubra]